MCATYSSLIAPTVINKVVWTELIEILTPKPKMISDAYINTTADTSGTKANFVTDTNTNSNMQHFAKYRYQNYAGIITNTKTASNT